MAVKLSLLNSFENDVGLIKVTTSIIWQNKNAVIELPVSCRSLIVVSWRYRDPMKVLIIKNSGSNTFSNLNYKIYILICTFIRLWQCDWNMSCCKKLRKHSQEQ